MTSSKPRENRNVIVKAAALSDVGRKRTLNEDNYSVFPEHGVYVVADGMGGHAAGEVASRIAVETMEEFMVIANQDDEITWPFDIDETLDTEANKLKTAIRLANKKIHEATLKQQKLEGMGTTIVCLMLRNGRAYVAHVGDSRAYLVRNGDIRAVTSDHSWVNIQVLLGTISKEEAQHHPMKNIITRALGTTSDVEVDISVRDVRTNDRYVLCSDGLSGLVTDDDIRRIVLEAGEDLESAAQRLIQLANSNGGDDNITCIVVGCEVEGDDGVSAPTGQSRRAGDYASLEDTVTDVDLAETLKNVPLAATEVGSEDATPQDSPLLEAAKEPEEPTVAEDISDEVVRAAPIAADEAIVQELGAAGSSSTHAS